MTWKEHTVKCTVQISTHKTTQPFKASLAKCVRLRTKRLWVQMPLQSLKLQISHLFRARHSFDTQQTIECRFTPKRVRDMIRTYYARKQIKKNDKATVIKDIIWFLKRMLKIKESWNLFWPKTQLTSPEQKM